MTIEDFPRYVTVRDKYGPAMEITEQSDADAYFEKCVRHTVSHGKSRAEAEKTERINLVYYAGYYSAEVSARVERLFRYQDPVFGSIEKNGPPTPEQAFEAGLKAGQSKR